MLPQKWTKILKTLDMAFQPIVHIANGRTYAVEALLRGYQDAGFFSIFNCFDEAYHDGVLYQFDLELRKKTLEKFKKLNMEHLQVFYNIDTRTLYMPDYSSGNTSTLLKNLDLPKRTICFEISERGTLNDQNGITNMINKYKQEEYDIALDDFGTGISGLQMLYHSEARYIKIDRFYIQNIQSDSKKRLFCASIVNMSHIMGMKVVAEGIEEVAEYYTCKDLGFDFIQGFMIQKPQQDLDKIKPVYKNVKKIFDADRRKNNKNKISKSFIEYIKPIDENATLHEIIVYFKTNPNSNFVPVVDKFDHLCGVIYEEDIKTISYSQYGISLAKNSSFNSKVSKIMRPAAVVEKYWGIDKTLEVYNMSKYSPKGIFVTKENIYYGFINVNNLLSLSYKRNLEIAKNQNPLTKLPGNSQIQEFLNKVFFENSQKNYHVVYFDFDDFKPFNDLYGFRQGDRAILLFTDILQKILTSDTFIAHIGGDDFFLGFEEKKYSDVYHTVEKIQDNFKTMVQELYNKEDIKKGHISAKDRFGIERKFHLLSISACIVEFIAHKNKIDDNSFDVAIGEAKKASKKVSYPLGISLL